MSEASESYNFENAPDGFDAALGTLTRRFGQMEHLLATIIHRMTREDWNGVLARLGSDLRDRKKLLQEVRRCFVNWAESSFEGTERDRRIAKFDRIGNDLRDSLVQRDQFTHCAWGYDAGGQFRATRQGKPLIIEYHAAGREDIERTSNELARCFKVLNEISRDPVGKERVNSSEIISSSFGFSATGASYPEAGSK